MRALFRLVVLIAAIVLPALGYGAPFAYITNTLGNTVSVIDTATNTVTSTIAVGSGPFALGQFLASPIALAAPTRGVPTLQSWALWLLGLIVVTAGGLALLPRKAPRR